MAAYSLASTISPIGPRGHRIVVTARASDLHSREEVAIDVTSTGIEAERRRSELLALIEEHLRDRGHEVVDWVDD